MGTKNNPGEFDCYANADPDEPMFILLGRDPVAAQLVRMWVMIRQDLGTITPDKAAEAHACADAMEKWARSRRADWKPIDDAKGAFRVVAHRIANGASMLDGRR